MPTEPEVLEIPALAWSTANCTVGRAMGVLGERWTFVVLREVFNGVRRFDDIQRHSGIPRQVLSDRLATLVGEGVLDRRPYRPPGGRERHEYRLTPKGFDLYPVLVAIADWGARYLADPAGPPVEVEHRGCGELVHAELVCEAGHRLADRREAAPRPGPGAVPAQK
ncbi:winged helix-turn-helix transcriptional regulator [Nocardioides mangrovi]|uniref:Helix-turn-helix transcriptional regulator n=1 Tax=Nocardioides mangrovi TaxID=2874580 RepID=A0ABS7UC76_9ACTN|nr:helix-turn-helix domain-containing protein [Nocardioides mangrovi]MBZ5738595.1 helix-turn-helix transcriptional regulator [Nocardioides mangrovi]